MVHHFMERMDKSEKMSRHSLATPGSTLETPKKRLVLKKKKSKATLKMQSQSDFKERKTLDLLNQTVNVPLLRFNDHGQPVTVIQERG